MTTVYDRNPSMPKPGGRAAWSQQFQPVLEDLRHGLRQQTPQEIALPAGIVWHVDDDAFLVSHLGQLYRVSWPDLSMTVVDTGEPCDVELQGLFLYYLRMADGTPAAHRWVAFRELPDGWLYHQAFQGYTGNVLAQEVGNDIERLHVAARAVGGSPLEVGDAGYAFAGLPHVPLALVYWLGDEEFPSQAQVLFDPAASHYLPIDGSAALGRRLVTRILREMKEGDRL